jgi:hypothetical protein
MVAARMELLFDPSRTSLPCNVSARTLARLIVRRRNNAFRCEFSSQQSRRKRFFILGLRQPPEPLYFSEPLGIAPSWLCRTGSPYPPGPSKSVPEPRLRIMPGLFIWGRGFAPGASKRRISKGEGKSIGPNSISLSSWSRSVVGTLSCPAPPPTPSYTVLLVSHWSHLNDLVGRYGRHSAPSAITWLGWHHCPGWHSNGAAAVPQLHFHAVGWPTAQAGITCISLCPRTCLAWATPIDMAIASSATQQVFSMSRPPCAAKTLLYRAAKFLGNRS